MNKEILYCLYQACNSAIKLKKAFILYWHMIGQLVQKMQTFFPKRNSKITIGTKKYAYLDALSLIPFFRFSSSRQKIYRKAKVSVMVFQVLEILKEKNIPQNLYPLNLGFYEKLLFLWDSVLKKSNILDVEAQEFVVESK